MSDDFKECPDYDKLGKMTDKIEPKDCKKGCIESSVCEGCSDFVPKGADKVLKVVPKPEKIDVECIIVNGCNECIDRSTADGHNQALDQYDSFIKTNLPTIEEVEKLVFLILETGLDDDRRDISKSIDKLYRQRLKVEGEK